MNQLIGATNPQATAGTVSAQGDMHPGRRIATMPNPSAQPLSDYETSQEVQSTCQRHVAAPKQSVAQEASPLQRLPGGTSITSASPTGNCGHDPTATIPYTLSRLVHSYLPPASTEMLIMRYSKSLNLPTQLVQRAYQRQGDTGLPPVVARPRLPPNVHPILMARRLIGLAVSLRQMNPRDINLTMDGKSPWDTAELYFSAASRYVTCNDVYVGSLDGLETLLLESVYRIITGNWRLAWLCCRRAISVGHLIGLGNQSRRPNESSQDLLLDSRAEYLWFRLIYCQRFLSLMLHLPFTATDNRFASEEYLASDSLMGKLERLHGALMGRIGERNDHVRQQTTRWATDHKSYTETQDIDHELKCAARLMPAKWWVTPELDSSVPYDEASQQTARVLTQVHHQNLLVLLHGPYFLSTCNGTEYTPNLTYSKTTATNASREVITRFTAYRDFQNLACFRYATDIKALTAVTTLLLGHLDGHRQGRGNTLDHQRMSDLGLIEEHIEGIESLAGMHDEGLAHSSASTLRKLVEIEEEAADGADFIILSEDRADLECSEAQLVQHVMSFEEMEMGVLKFTLPLYGTVILKRKGSRIERAT